MAVRRLLAELEFPTLRSVGIVEDDLDDLVLAALGAWIPVEPGPWDADAVYAAYAQALALGRSR